MRRMLALFLAVFLLCAASAYAQTEIQWWHSMTGANNTGVNELAAKFNASQSEYKVVPVFKGSYPESMTAAIAAFRAGNPPHILQVFDVNKGAFKKAGLDPEKAPKTWKEFAAAAQKLKAAGQECVYTTGWPAWMHIENFSAWHNVPIGTKKHGMDGLDTEFRVNSPLHVRHVSMLGD